jgi:biotin operon repressor
MVVGVVFMSPTLRAIPEDTIPELSAGQEKSVGETATRTLALLSLLQTRPDWSGADLARRLGVSDRTVRNDVTRLRDLGYPVDAVRGPGGRYRLGIGAKLPPLLLDDEEAVAVAVGLRAATGVAGVEETSARALAKLEQVLPDRLRRKLQALIRATTAGPVNTDSNVEDPEVDAPSSTTSRSRSATTTASAVTTGTSRWSSSPTTWSPGNGAGTSWPATRGTTRGRRTVSTGCASRLPGEGRSPRPTSPAT